ncbi:hypothetical protein Asi02nite_39600 [Asanoa siamensis]|uniref:Mannosyltransferase PIG-V n=1 Tax=Asanoa siamensis TaxID=926357 RepID=A0ABQ4CT44_9ACTN|nr:hypothetical protein Asi02nite_39600 [Asanoa siamensis]
MLPVGAYLARHLVFALAATRADFDWLDTASRIRWDGGIYLDIAHNGYYAAPCSEINPSVGTAGSLCGNAGWFPLFPYVLNGLSRITGLGLDVTGVLLAEVCALGVLVAVWRLLDARVNAANLGCLTVAAALPSSVYFHATFPMSLTVLLTMITFTLLTRGHWAIAGLAGGAAAMAYPLAAVLAPAAAAFFFLAPNRTWRQIIPAAYVAGSVSVGTFAVFGLLFFTTGRFTAYLSIQGNYGHGVNNPVRTVLALLDRSPHIVSAELLFSASMVGLALIAVVRPASRAQVTTLDRTLAMVYGPLLLIVPLVVGANLSQYRSHTLMLPLVLLMRHLRTGVVMGLAVVSVPLVCAMATLFLTGDLV